MRPSGAAERPADHVEEHELSRDHLEAVHSTLARFWSLLQDPPDEQWRLRFEIAVAEIAANIVEHASPPSITIRLRMAASSVIAEFTDSGAGWTGKPGPAAVIDELSERGRGLALTEAAVDQVAYERHGRTNHWRLTKHL
ncbi:MAG TPA: ATP-binding protein [Candidatus Dormibacteraeota bacterium]|jgi:serine/threonine-protein kinase RsbW